MYRFLIIDDEPVVREGISENIDWAAHGFELVGACRDGREGLAAVERERPDVVLTDICMPFVDGLELAATISEQYPGTRTLLLTGYDEFEYAQEAVKLKVWDFLLKPITAEELRWLLDTLKAEIDAERSRRAELARLTEQLEESLPVLRERFLNRLVRESVDPDELPERLSLLDLDLPGPVWIVMVCDPDGGEATGGLAAIALQQVIDTAMGDCPGSVSFSSAGEQGVMILSASDETEATSDAIRCAEHVSASVARELGQTVSIGIGDPATGLPGIGRSYREARMALAQRLVRGPDQIITVQQVRGAGDGVAGSPDRGARDRFSRALKTGERNEAHTALSELFSYFRTRSDAPAAGYVAVQRLLADSLNALESLGIGYEELHGPGSNPFEELSRLKTLEDMERWFRELEEATCRLLEGRREQNSRRKAVAAEEYIHAHYREPGISLTDMCSTLSVSKSYLSPIFKEHTGLTFVEYLTRVRIEKAKEFLLSGELKTYEVAWEVGFRDAHYFSLTFRKQTGVSPTEYREAGARTGT
jgi:two-component system response regulator YesN